MKRRGFAVSGWFAVASIAAMAVGEAAAEPRAVVELFTSQGCSSCPPADKLLGELANDRSILAMSLPIDYWDYLGWKDTLARPRHTARQRGYAVVRGDREVYTPQAVVNGMTHVLGSDRNAIEGAISKTKRNETLAVPVSVSVKEEHVDVTVTAAAAGGAPGEVWLCAIVKAIPVAIPRGENRGRTVTYHNVVRKWVKVGAWTGKTQTWSVPKDDFVGADADTVAVLVQSGTVESPGAVLGASVASLR